MSDPQAPDPAEQPRSLREERRAAETVALNKDQLQQLQEQARQQAAPPAEPAARPRPAGQPTSSSAPPNHLVLALALAAGVVVLVLLLALFAS